MEIPKGHTAVMPYLILKDAAGFIDFTQTIFNASLTHKGMRDNTNVIQHAEININGSTIMCADATEQFVQANANMFIYVGNADDTYHRAIELGAKSVTELSNQDYGRTCGIEDKWGNVWWVTSI